MGQRAAERAPVADLGVAHEAGHVGEQAAVGLEHLGVLDVVMAGEAADGDLVVKRPADVDVETTEDTIHLPKVTTRTDTINAPVVGVQKETVVVSKPVVGTEFEVEAELVLLDNMSPAQLREAVALVAGRAITEASGRVTVETAPAIAATGVDLISSGAITHSARTLDLGLDFDSLTA